MIVRIANYNIVSYSMIALGAIALLLSISSSSYVLAFIGLGLVFWGTLFLHIRPTKYVKLELLNATSSSTLINIERILITAKTYQKGVYLPPKNLQDPNSSLVFIPTEPNQPLPTSAETIPQKVQSKNPTGFYITPPGLALSKLFEKELRRPFTGTTMEDLQERLPQLFEELQITKNLIVNIENDTVTIQMQNHIFEEICDETKKLERTHETVGCPLTSALACVLAKTIGKPITIQNDTLTSDKTTVIKYKIMEDT
jgi:hypothetical protein